MSRTFPGPVKPAPAQRHSQPRWNRGRRAWFFLRSCFLGLCLIVGASDARAGADPAGDKQFTEPQIKARWLFEFFERTAWPQDATNNSAPYLLGILGKDPFGEDLLKQIAQKKVNNRPVTIKRCRNAAEASACHVVFISASEKERLTEILNALKDSSVLTVGETDEFARLGGIIGLTIGKEKAFELNKAAYKRSRLKIDSRVLVIGKLL